MVDFVIFDISST